MCLPMNLDPHYLTFHGPLEAIVPVETPPLGDFFFFKLVLDGLGKQIDSFRESTLAGFGSVTGAAALTLMTLWLLIQGYRIITGQSRDSMAALVTNMARSAFIVSLATSVAMYGGEIQRFLLEDVKGLISFLITGKKVQPEDQIRDALSWMQLAFTFVDSIHVIGDSPLADEKAKAQLLIALGTGGPAVVAGSMLLLYKIALALFVGLGPLFVLCLLFEQTKQLFQRWLLYGLGTMFSMAVMAAMVSISLNMVIKVSILFWGMKVLDQGGSISSLAMQQGGMGLILTTLIVTAPPMAAMFFQGTLGNFIAYSQIGGSSGDRQPGPQGQPPGSSSVVGSARSPVDAVGGGPATHSIAGRPNAPGGSDVSMLSDGRRGHAS